MTGSVRHPLPGVVYPDPTELAQYVEAGLLGSETLVEGFRQACARYPDNLALTGIGLAMTYAELDSLSTRLAAALNLNGLAPLDRMIFQLGDSAELVIAFLACLKAGVIPICTLAAHREQEIGYLADLADAKAHLVQGDNAKFDDVAFAQKMQGVAPSLKWIVQARGVPRSEASHLQQLIDSVSEDDANAILENIELDPCQVAVFQLSGGTTGVPKIIPRFHNEYLYNMRAVAAWLDYRPDDVLFIPQPMVHNLNMGCCFGPFLMTGGTVTIVENVLRDTLVATVAHARPSWLVLGGPILARLDNAISAGELDLSNARGVIAPGNAPVLREKLGTPVYHVFGMTEGVIMFTHPDDPPEALDTTHGRPVSVADRVRITRPGTEEEVAPGETGEPVFKGPYTIRGYYRAEERNHETFTSDGYYRSGDLMVENIIDGKSYYTFCGRTKDLVSRGGEKINCEEVETAVAGHPAVAAVAAVGYPDPVFDERLCAAIIPSDGCRAPSVAELGTYLQEFGLAKFKWPERIEVMEEFPVTSSGKLSKPALREFVSKRLANESEPPSG